MRPLLVRLPTLESAVSSHWLFASSVMLTLLPLALTAPDSLLFSARRVTASVVLATVSRLSAFIVCTFFTLISADPESTAKALPPDAVAVMLPPSIVATFFPPLNEKATLLPETLLWVTVALLALSKAMAADCSLVISVLFASRAPP